jgi:preprotein translocase subunit SecG
MIIVGGVTATAVMTLLLVSVNARFYLDWIYYDPQEADEFVDMRRVNAFMTATAGFMAGPLLGALTGGLLRRYRPAIAAGMLFALVDIAIAWPMSASYRHRLAAGAAVEGRLLWTTVAVGLAVFPVAAVLGVALGRAAVRRRRAAIVFAGVVVSFSLVYGVLLSTGSADDWGHLLGIAVLPLAGSLAAPACAALGNGTTFVFATFAAYGLWALIAVLLDGRHTPHEADASARG